MDYSSSEDASVEAPVNPDIPDFEVVAPRLWMGRTVELHDVDGNRIAEGLPRNLRSSALTDVSDPIGDSEIVVQVSSLFVEVADPDDWIYSFKTWPIRQVFLGAVSLFYHSQRNLYNRWLVEHARERGKRTRSYDNSSRNIPTPVSRKAQVLLTSQSINEVASNTCCSQNCVQHYPREKIKVLRSRMYENTTVQFKNHIKLDVHRQFHSNAEGRNVVTLEGIDVCPFAWMKIIGVSSSTFYRNAQNAAAGYEAQRHGNAGMRKPRSHPIVASAVLGALLDRHADHMPHKSHSLPSGEKIVFKVLPSSFKWKDQIPILDAHLADCGLPPVSVSNLSKIRKLSFPEYYAKRAGDNFARCSKCDEYALLMQLTQPGSQFSLLWSRKLKTHLDSAFKHRDLYYLNRFRSKEMPRDFLTIMHDKMDHSKTASPALSHKVKNLDCLMKLPLSVTGILAHGHVDERYAHYGLDVYSHDANYTVGSFAKLLRDLEAPPKSSSRQIFTEAPSHLLYAALLRGSELCLDPLGPVPDTPIDAKPLPPILNVQMDNAISDNKNRYVFCFWSLLVAKRIFREIYVNFMLVGHTHDDIDALFGRWSMALRKEDFPTVPLLMKSFMKTDKGPTIPHLVQEVPDFKKFIEDSLFDGDETLTGHTKAHQFKFYVDPSGCPVMKYKLLCHNDVWLPKGDDKGIKLWKEDAEGRSLWPRGEPDAMRPHEMRHLPEIVKGLSGFVDHWERLSRESIESRRMNEPLSYYWSGVRDALSTRMDTLVSTLHGISSSLEEPIPMQYGFWPSTRLPHAIEDEFTLEGNLREEYGKDDHFVGHRRDCPAPSFRDLFKGYFVALRPCGTDGRPFWLGRAMSDPNSNTDLPNTVEIQIFRPIAHNRDVQKYYTAWDSNRKLKWTVERGVPISTQSIASIFTAWKSKIRKPDGDCNPDDVTITIPIRQIKIIKASLAEVAASLAAHESSDKY